MEHFRNYETLDRRTSKVWNFFTRDKDDRGRVICGICSKKIKGDNGTSAMRGHLLRIHSVDTSTLQEDDKSDIRPNGKI